MCTRKQEIPPPAACVITSVHPRGWGPHDLNSGPTSQHCCTVDQVPAHAFGGTCSNHGRRQLPPCLSPSWVLKCTRSAEAALYDLRDTETESSALHARHRALRVVLGLCLPPALAPGLTLAVGLIEILTWRRQTQQRSRSFLPLACSEGSRKSPA